MLARLPPILDRDSSWSIEGTALHTVIEELITGKTSLDELRGRRRQVDARESVVTITDELIHDALEPAWQFWEKFLEDVDTWQLETEVAFPGIPGSFGTADVLARDDVENITHVVDWKFGSGVGVRAAYDDPDDPDFEVVNEQLLFYATAAWHTLPGLFPPGARVILWIVQPRVQEGDPITAVEVSVADLIAFAKEMGEALAVSKVAGAPIKLGRWCRFAACRTICPLHTGPLLDLEIISQGAASDRADPAYRTMLLDVLKAAPGVEALIKEARAQAHVMLANGEELEGWKLVQKRPTRQWTVDEAELARALRKAHKVKKAQLYNSVLKSPAQVEKILPPKAKLPDGLALPVSSGTTLAPASDKRPAIAIEAGALSKVLLDALAQSVEGD